MNNGYIGFLCGIAVGVILGVMALSIILVMTDERKKREGGR